jgi:vitamin B12 transporter
VERIEVIRGAATAEFGGGAAAGAINIVSRPPEAQAELQGSGRVSVGSFGELRAESTVAHTAGSATALRWSISAVGSNNRYAYRRAGEADTRVNAGGREAAASLAMERPVAAGQVSAELRASAGDRGLAGSVEFPSDEARLQQAAVTGASTLSYPVSPGSAWSLTGDISGGFQQRHYQDPGYAFGDIDTAAQLQRGALRAQVDGPIAPAVTATVEANASVEALDDSDLGTRTQWSTSVAPTLAAETVVFGGHTLSSRVVARGEMVSQEGRRSLLPSLRLTAAWRIPAGPSASITVSGALGSAYRLPSFSELFWPAGAFAVGNPDLEPERSRTAELAIRGDFSHGGYAELRGHGAWYGELIQWLPDPRGVWQPRNSGAARILGVEAVTGLRRPLGVSPWTVDVETGGEVLHAVDRSAGATYNRQLPYRPELSRHAQAALDHLAGHGASVTLTGVGARPVTAANPRWLDPYLRIDLAGQAAVPGTGLRVGAAVHNLLDRSFVETRFYPNAGREISVYMEARW